MFAKTKRTKILSLVLLFFLLFSFIDFNVDFDTDKGICIESFEVSANPGAWYSASWTKRKAITIDNTKVAGDLTDFPVLISLSSDSDVNASAQSDGDDILFTSSDGVTKLDHEIEYYSEGTLTAWVEIPSLSRSVDTTLYMYYGNAGASNQENATGTWSNGYVMVQHMKDATTSTILDSTSYDNDGTKKGANEPIEADGKIYKAQNFDGTDDYIDCGTSTDIDLAGTRTISCWVKIDTMTDNKAIWGTAVDNDNKTNLRIMSSKLQFFSRATTNQIAISTGTLSTDTWYYIAVTLDETGQVAKIYSDIHLEEVRVSNIVRSPDWIETKYNNMNDPSTFYNIGSEVTYSAPTVTITNPNSGDVMGGSYHDITWTWDYPDGDESTNFTQISLYFTPIGGSSYPNAIELNVDKNDGNIQSWTDAGGTYRWDYTSTQDYLDLPFGDRYRVKIVATYTIGAGTDTCNDASDGDNIYGRATFATLSQYGSYTGFTQNDSGKLAILVQKPDATAYTGLNTSTEIFCYPSINEGSEGSAIPLTEVGNGVYRFTNDYTFSTIGTYRFRWVVDAAYIGSLITTLYVPESYREPINYEIEFVGDIDFCDGEATTIYFVVEGTEGAPVSGMGHASITVEEYKGTTLNSSDLYTSDQEIGSSGIYYFDTSTIDYSADPQWHWLIKVDDGTAKATKLLYSNVRQHSQDDIYSAIANAQSDITDILADLADMNSTLTDATYGLSAIHTDLTTLSNTVTGLTDGLDIYTTANYMFSPTKEDDVNVEWRIKTKDDDDVIITDMSTEVWEYKDGNATELTTATINETYGTNYAKAEWTNTDIATEGLTYDVNSTLTYGGNTIQVHCYTFATRTGYMLDKFEGTTYSDAMYVYSDSACRNQLVSCCHNDTIYFKGEGDVTPLADDNYMIAYVNFIDSDGNCVATYTVNGVPVINHIARFALDLGEYTRLEKEDTYYCAVSIEDPEDFNKKIIEGETQTFTYKVCEGGDYITKRTTPPPPTTPPFNPDTFIEKNILWFVAIGLMIFLSLGGKKVT